MDTQKGGTRYQETIYDLLKANFSVRQANAFKKLNDEYYEANKGKLKK